jgi:outer membrane lipoprotein-sorting protein
MKSNQRIAGFLTLCSVAIVFVACANQMEPAKNALDNINTTLNSVSAEAQKYVPDQFAEAQTRVAALTASFEKKDYAAVVAGAPRFSAWSDRAAQSTARCSRQSAPCP